MYFQWNNRREISLSWWQCAVAGVEKQ